MIESIMFLKCYFDLTTLCQWNYEKHKGDGVVLKKQAGTTYFADDEQKIIPKQYPDAFLELRENLTFTVTDDNAMGYIDMILLMKHGFKKVEL